MKEFEKEITINSHDSGNIYNCMYLLVKLYSINNEDCNLFFGKILYTYFQLLTFPQFEDIQILPQKYYMQIHTQMNAGVHIVLHHI